MYDSRIICITCYYHYCAGIPVLTYAIIYALRELDYTLLAIIVVLVYIYVTSYIPL